jgi:hypothetical protein
MHWNLVVVSNATASILVHRQPKCVQPANWQEMFSTKAQEKGYQYLNTGYTLHLLTHFFLKVEILLQKLE